MRRAWWDWQDAVVEQVRFWPDRAKIAEELAAHYEDHVKDLERIGYDRALAQERALTAMGDPVEVGKAMDKAHRPWLGWLWMVSKWTAVACVFVLTIMILSDGSYWMTRLKNVVEPVQREGDYEPDGYHAFSEGWERDNAVRVMVGKGASTVERDGDTFSVPYAAVWKCHYPASNENRYQAYDLYWVTVVLAADDTNPFDTRQGNFVSSLSLALDDGRWYHDDYGYLETDQNGVDIWGPGDGNLAGGWRASDAFRSLYYFWLCAGEEPLGEWCELSYPNGEPWSIRIDWEEVEP